MNCDAYPNPASLLYRFRRQSYGTLVAASEAQVMPPETIVSTQQVIYSNRFYSISM